MFIDAWFLIFKILRVQHIPDWFFNLHSNRDLAKNLDSIDKEIMLECMETYPDKKVLDIFLITVTNYLAGRDRSYHLSKITSKLNHNEDNNVVPIVQANCIQLLLLCDVKANTELFIKYPTKYGQVK